MNFKGHSGVANDHFGIAKNYKKAIECLKFASSKGISKADVVLASLSYDLYKISKKQDSKSDSDYYLTYSKNLLTKEKQKENPVALYNLAVIKLETEKFSTELNSELSKLLEKSLNGFVKIKDKNRAMKVLEFAKDKNLINKENLMDLYNQKF